MTQSLCPPETSVTVTVGTETITVAERPQSRSFNTKGGSLIYLITGTQSQTNAMAALVQATPTTQDVFSRNTVGADLIEGSLDAWTGTVGYVIPGTKPLKKGQVQPGDPDEVEFEVGGDSWHITQSLWTKHKFGAGQNTPPDFGGAINVTRDLDGNYSVEGVTLGTTQGAFLFSIKKAYARSSVNSTYVKTLADLIWHTNSTGSFAGFDAGEVLFVGARGSVRGDGNFEITFRFARLPNIDAPTGTPPTGGITIGSITGIHKLGWDYLWVYYKVIPDPATGFVTKVPWGVYIEQVYEDGVFDALDPDYNPAP